MTASARLRSAPPMASCSGLGLERLRAMPRQKRDRTFALGGEGKGGLGAKTAPSPPLTAEPARSCNLDIGRPIHRDPNREAAVSPLV